jgi:GNAT superfamily N-acetyltransferase
MTRADISAGLGLCRAAHWNQTARDWEHFLTTSPDGTLVADQDGDVVGTVAMLPYGPFAWISMVLVEPTLRGQGIGTLLLHRGIALVPEGAVARLDATPAGEPLYRKIGFVGEYGISRWYLEADSRLAAPIREPKPLEDADWPAIREMDVRVFGASRLGLLQRLAREAPEYAWLVVGNEARLTGYVFGRHGHVREHIGPLVASDAETAAALLAACVGSKENRPVFVDVPDAQLDWREMLSRAGFAIERRFLRMYRGKLSTPGEPLLVHAIAGPELG